MRIFATLVVGCVLSVFSVGTAAAQSADDVLNGVGRLIQFGVRAATQAEWERISSAELSCVDQRLNESARSINSVIAQGIGPADPRMAEIRNACRGGFDSRREPVAATDPGVVRPGVAYTVDGLQLGKRVAFESPAYREYTCTPSEQFAAFTWCQRRKSEISPRGAYASSNTILHAPDGTALYINRYLEPAFFAGNEASDDINRLAVKFGPARTVPIPAGRIGPNGLIAYWGAVSLTPLEPVLVAQLAAGNDVRAGLLIDYIGNFQRSAKMGLPIYRLGGGAGFVWAASWGDNGRGTLRFLAIDASRLGVPPQAELAAQNQPASQIQTPPATAPDVAVNPVPPASTVPGPTSVPSVALPESARPQAPPQQVQPAAPPDTPAMTARRPPDPSIIVQGVDNKAGSPPANSQISRPATEKADSGSASARPAEPAGKPEVRVIVPAPVQPVSASTEKSVFDGLVAILIATILVLIGAVIFLAVKARRKPETGITAFIPSSTAASADPETGIPAPSPPAIDLVTLTPEEKPDVAPAAGRADDRADELPSPPPVPVKTTDTEMVDRANQPASGVAVSGWVWAAAALVVPTLLLLPYGIAALLPIALAIYLFPSIIAFKRRHLYAWVILGINLFFGFTGLVWLAMLIWAITGDAMSALDSMRVLDGNRGSGPDAGVAVSERDLRSGWSIPVIQGELFAFEPSAGPLVIGSQDVSAYLKSPLIGLFPRVANGRLPSAVLYDVKSQVRCVTAVTAETKIRVGKTVARSALTGLGAAIFSGRHAALGGAILDYRFAGNETEDVISAVIVFSDFSTIAFQCEAGEFEKLAAFMPPDALTEERAEQTEEQLSRIKRMADDGPRVLDEMEAYLVKAREHVSLLSTQAVDGGTFAERDQARQELVQATVDLDDAQAVKKAVESLIASAESGRLKSA